MQKIVAIKASMNLGLSQDLKTAFPNIKPVARPLVVDQEIKDSYWLSGFAAGEGCFMVGIKKSSASKFGVRVLLRFQVTQHYRDAELMRSLIKYLGCGQVYNSSAGGERLGVLSWKDSQTLLIRSSRSSINILLRV